MTPRFLYVVVALVILAAVLSALAADCLGALPAPLEATANNVVRVAVGTSRASGVYIGNQYVLTARHLFDGEGTTQATATFRIGDERISGRLISAIDSAWDSAVIRLEREPDTPLPSLQVSRDLRPGDVLWVAGYSGGDLGYRDGPFIAFRHLRQYSDQPEWYVEFKAPSYSGDSGGPVFLADGSLVGTMWGSGGPHGPRCSNEFHRTYSIALCAKFTRRLISALLPRGKLFPRLKGEPQGRQRSGCPSGGCPNPQGELDVEPRAPWDSDAFVPPEPPPPTMPPAPSTDLSGILTELAALRQAIEAMELQPGPQGELGPPGARGPPGPPGAGKAGVDGADGQAFDVAALTDEQIEALRIRLGPISFRHTNGITGETILPAEPVYLGQGYEFLQFPSDREHAGRLPQTTK